MILDDRIKGSRCEHCAIGRELILGETLPFECQNCKNRPRKFDTDNFIPEYQTEEIKEIMDAEARKGTAADY